MPERGDDTRPIRQHSAGAVPLQLAHTTREARTRPIVDDTPASLSLTQSTLSEPSVGLGRGQWRRGVLDLRGSRGARLAHGIGAVHGEWWSIEGGIEREV